MKRDCFRYHTGEVVCVGDRVMSEGRLYGVVQSITFPGTNAAELEGDPDGSVTIGENVNGIMSLSAHHPATEWDSVAWKTTVFLRRGAVITSPYGSGTVRWPYEPGPSPCPTT